MAVMKAYQREYVNKLVKPERKEWALTLKNIGTIDQETILDEAASHSKLDVDTYFGKKQTEIRGEKMKTKVGLKILEDAENRKTGCNVLFSNKSCTFATMKRLIYLLLILFCGCVKAGAGERVFPDFVTHFFVSL